MAFEMSDIPAGKQPGWNVRVDGVEVAPGSVRISSERYGVVHYGQRPEGYDSWVFYMQDSAVTIPWSRTPRGELLIALVEERRINLGEEPTWCAIGGFFDPGETAEQAEARERTEESGIKVGRPVRLCLPTVEDRLLFVADPATGAGCNTNFGLQIGFEHLSETGDQVWQLNDSALLPEYKKADAVRFFPWKVAIGLTPDGVALAAIAQLLTEVL